MTAPKNYLKPDLLARIAALGLQAEKIVEGTISGKHASPFHGVSAEFADYQEYKPGDDLKRLDWRVLARSDRVVIKRFEDETNLKATILVDASASMGYGRDGARKFDTAAILAASLATLMLRQQDAVGCMLYDEKTRTVLPPSSRRGQLNDILKALISCEPDRTSELSEGMWHLAEKMKRRGLVIILSDLFFEHDRFFESLGRLQFQGHEILLFHVLHRDELELPFAGSVVFEDIEGDEEIHADPWAFRKDYQAAMKRFVSDVREQARQRGIDVLNLTTDEDPGTVLSRYLHWRQRRTVRR